MKFTIKNSQIQDMNGSTKPDFPKYTSQLVNWANQNAQGTRPKMVGRLAELFPQYRKQAEQVTLEGWEAWYLDKYPDAIQRATEKIYAQVCNLQTAIQQIDRKLVEEWVHDLVIEKTYHGLNVQNAILAYLASL